MKPPNPIHEYKREIARLLKQDRMEQGPVVIDLPNQQPVTRSFMSPEELLARQSLLPSPEAVQKVRKKNVGSIIVANLNRASLDGQVGRQ